VFHAQEGGRVPTTIEGYAPGVDKVPALLTPGELVLPPEITRWFESALGQRATQPGSAVSHPIVVNMTIHAMDAQSFAAYMHKNRDVVASVVGAAMSENHPLRRMRL
jgi:hypothetical protein